jgi:hypothetical protein
MPTACKRLDRKYLCSSWVSVSPAKSQNFMDTPFPENHLKEIYLDRYLHSYVFLLFVLRKLVT